MTKPRILIEGDSWAYTWYPPKKQPQAGFVEHPGFGSMLEDLGWSVTVNAKSASSNDQIAQRLAENTSDWDLAIVIQTEPMRDWLTVLDERDGSMRLDTAKTLPLIQQCGGLDSAVRQHLLTPFYQKLKQSAIDKPVWLIGGCAPIQLDLIEPYENFTAVIPSMTEWLLPTVKDCLYQNSWAWSSSEYAETIMKLGDIDLIRDWFDITQRMRDKLAAWGQDTQYFNPDKWHPNRSAHEKIAQLLDPLLAQQFANR